MKNKNQKKKLNKKIIKEKEWFNEKKRIKKCGMESINNSYYIVNNRFSSFIFGNARKSDIKIFINNVSG